MDNLENLSDAELQQRLIQNGLPKVPITATTRDVIIKKLRNQMRGSQNSSKSVANSARKESNSAINSMDNLDQLSDSELRGRLSQYGFSNVPVTATTRKTLVKKLRSQMNTEKSRLRRETTNATRYSSGEESDLDSNRSPATKFYGNTTSSYISQYNTNMMPPPAARTTVRRTVPNASSTLNRLGNESTRSPERPAKSLISVPPVVYSNETDEDSDFANSNQRRETYNSFLTYKSRYSGSPAYPESTNFTPSSPAYPVLGNYSPSQNYVASSAYTAPSNFAAQSTHSSNYATAPSYGSPSSYISSNYNMTGNTVLNENAIRNRYSTSPITGRPATTSQSLASDHSPIINGHSGDELSYSDDFTRRLLSLRGESIRQTGYKPTSTIRSRYTTTPNTSFISTSPADIVHQQPEPAAEGYMSPWAMLQNLMHKLNSQYVFKQSFIPCLLLSALLIFFIILTVMYVTISPDLANTISEKNAVYTLCPETIQFTGLTTNDYNCIQKNSVRAAIKSLKHIAPELQRRAQHQKCVDHTGKFIMSRQDVGKHLVTHDTTLTSHNIFEIFPNMEYLIANNPQWKIFNVDSEGNPLSIRDIIQLRENREHPKYAILNPRVPFSCSLYNKFQKFFFFIGGLAVVSLICALLYFCYQVVVRHFQSKREIVNSLIDDILSNLMKNSSQSLNANGVVVNHLRDKLIPLQNRKKHEWAWNEAIKHLEQHESRIQFEIAVLNGEDFKVMKWIDSVGSEQVETNSPVKKWQSPAFDKSHKMIDPPTPCLKIGQMFDKFEAKNPNLKTVIQDAILEKVGSKCRVYDIQLDTTNCFVYVRCASERDAGMIYDEINGWWFDSRLVSIKFVRLERYMTRFPKSTAGTCLRPSNSKNLSLSQCDKTHNRFEDDDDDYGDDNDRNDIAQRRN